MNKVPSTPICPKRSSAELDVSLSPNMQNAKSTKKLATDSTAADINPFAPRKNLIKSPIMKPKKNDDATTTSILYNVQTHNQYDALNTLPSNSARMTNQLEQNQQQRQLIRTKNLIPPIVIAGAANFKRTLDYVNELNIKDYKLKHMSIGVKFMFSDKDSYTKIENILRNTDIKYFTHDSVDIQPLKFVLEGLPAMEKSDIEEELKLAGLSPLEVVVIKRRRERYENDALYIVSFKKDSIKLKELQKIRTIYHTIVKWKSYIKNNKGPIMCYKCSMYGHGGRNCHLTPKCFNCGGEHTGENCQATTVKCGNCQGSHNAKSMECPKRQEFINMRQRLSAQNNRRRPSTTNTRNPLVNIPGVMPELRIPPSSSRADAWYSNFTFRPAPAPAPVPSSLPYPKEDLFSHSQILEITTEVFSKLHGCKSKAEQLRAIIDITSKYLYSDLP